MRLGGYFHADTLEELEPLCAELDAHGLSAIRAPGQLAQRSDEDCAAFGEKARQLDLHIGEAGFWQNLIDPDREAVAQRIQTVRTMLRKADLMGARCVVTLVGSKDPESPLAPHPDNFTDVARQEFREVCLRILDGLELKTCRYVIEPWVNTFFQKPDEILAFLQSVDHPSLGLHMDLMNMVTPETYYRTTELAHHAFDLLEPYIASVHAKDILWSYGKQRSVYQLDEVYVGDGVMDYDAYLQRLDRLDPDLTVYTEHYSTREEYQTALQRLRQAAKNAGARFLPRNP